MSERVPEPPERPEDVIWRALMHPEPYKLGDPRCPGCKAEAALAALLAAKEAAERERDAQRAYAETMATQAVWEKERADKVKRSRDRYAGERDALAEALREISEMAPYPGHCAGLGEVARAALAGLNEPEGTLTAARP